MALTMQDRHDRMLRLLNHSILDKYELSDFQHSYKQSHRVPRLKNDTAKV